MVPSSIIGKREKVYATQADGERPRPVRFRTAGRRRTQRRWFAILAGMAIVVVLGTAAGLWSVFNGWRDLMTTRAQFIAGIVDQQSVKGDHVGAMLIGLDALPDETSEGHPSAGIAAGTASH
jgi:hypothetical protein